MHTEIDISQWIIASGILILLLILFSNALKFYVHKTSSSKLPFGQRRLKVKETLYLDPRNRICLIELDGTEMVISISPNGIDMLGSQEAPTDIPEMTNPCTPERMSGIGFLKKLIKGDRLKPTDDPNPNKEKKSKK